MKGHIFFISGPSGVGKTTIMNAIRKDMPFIKHIISVKTRPLRPNEVDGVDIHSYTKEQFEAVKDDNNTFLEWAMYNNDYYGTLKKDVLDGLDNGTIMLKEIEVQGMEAIHRENRLPRNAYTMIFLYPAESNYKDTFIERLMKIDERGVVDSDEIERRKAFMENEFACAEWYDIWIYSEYGKIQKAIDDTKDAINAVLERMNNNDNEI